MIKPIYVIRNNNHRNDEEFEKDKETLEHAWDAYQQRRAYDKQKRHERYIRDRDAGKTGYLGVYGRGRRATDLSKYKYNAKVSAPVRMSAKKKEHKSPVDPEPEEEKSSRGSGNGSGGSRGSGAAEEAGKVREMSAEAKEKLREEANEKIERLREEIQEKSEEVKSQIEEDRYNQSLDRENKKNQAQIDIEKEQDEAANSIKSEGEKLKSQLKSKTDPIREELAALRAKAESTNDPEELARLKRVIASKKDNINDKNAEYTESVSKMSTEYSTKMRDNINKIRNDLKTFLNKSTQEQKEKATKLRNELKTLRANNNAEIKRIRQQLKNDLKEESSNAKQKISQIKSGQGNASDYTPKSSGSSGNSSNVVKGTIKKSK